MNGSTSETPETAPLAAAPATETTQPKAKSRARKPRGAAAGAKATKKATPVKKTPKSASKAKGAAKPKAAKPAKAAKATGPRDGSKTEKILTLLKRAGGATLKELMKATGWQAHSVRGFISAAVGKKMGLKVASTKDKGGERTYSVKG